jgi:predicted transcriptional regulator
VRAEATFLDGTACLLDERLVAWHRAGALFSLAYHLLARRKGNWLERAGEFLREAARSIQTAVCLPPATHSTGAGILPRVAVIVDAPLPGAAGGAQAADESTTPGAASREPNPALRARAAAERPGHHGTPSPWLSGLDLALLRALWARGEATANEVSASVDRSIGAAKVARRLSLLERKGVVTRRVVGRGGIYRAAVDQVSVQRSVVENFASYTDALFEGDLASLVCQLVRARDVDASDLERVIALLKARERNAEGGGA